MKDLMVDVNFLTVLLIIESITCNNYPHPTWLYDNVIWVVCRFIFTCDPS